MAYLLCCFYDLYNYMLRKASERAHISVEALILMLDRVPHDDIKALHEYCYTEDTELLAMQAWAIDPHDEQVEEIQELIKWLATGGMYDALAEIPVRTWSVATPYSPTHARGLSFC